MIVRDVEQKREDEHRADKVEEEKTRRMHEKLLSNRRKMKRSRRVWKEDEEDREYDEVNEQKEEAG